MSYMSVKAMITKKLIKTYNFQKNDSMKNSPTAVETGLAVVINQTDNLAIIDVDIHHDYDETKKQEVRKPIVDKLIAADNQWPIAVTARGGLHIYCLDNDFANELMHDDTKNRFVKAIKTDDFEVDLFSSRTAKDKRSLVIAPGSRVKIDDQELKYQWLNGKWMSEVKHSVVETLELLDWDVDSSTDKVLDKLLDKVCNDADEDLPELIDDDAVSPEQAVGFDESKKPTNEQFWVLVYGFEGVDIHGYCCSPGLNESAIAMIYATLLWCISEYITEDDVEDAIDWIHDNAKLTKPCKDTWDTRIRAAKRDFKRGKIVINNLGYIINCLKSGNPQYYKEHVAAINKDSIEAIKVHDMDFNDEFGLDDLIEKIATDEYKSIAGIVSDLTRVLRFVNTEGGIYIRKDFEPIDMTYKITYLDVTAMHKLAINCKKIKLTPNMKAITLWDIITNHINVFTVRAVKFYSDSPKLLNFFHGYKYQTQAQTESDIELNTDIIKPWLDFIKECIADDGADDNEAKVNEIYNYLINWIAYIIQNPGSKTEAAIVIKGFQGTGKGTFTDVLSEMLAGYSAGNITDMDRITGKYNSVLENKKLVVLNEAKNAGDDRYANFDSLKSKITDNTVDVGEKYKPSRTIDNVCNYIICSNNTNPVKIESSDRRYLVLRTNDKHQNDRKYFGPIKRAVYSNVVNKIPSKEFFQVLTKYFMSIDISEYDPRDIPDTEVKQDLKIASENHMEIWIREHYQELVEGKTFVVGDIKTYTPCNVPAKIFRAFMNDHCKQWKPQVDGKRATRYYYKLKDECVNTFKPVDDAAIDNNIELIQ